MQHDSTLTIHKFKYELNKEEVDQFVPMKVYTQTGCYANHQRKTLYTLVLSCQTYKLNIPIIMRLWKDKLNEYGDLLSDSLPAPIFFVAMNVKVTTFNDLSLASLPTSIFLRDALVRESTDIKEWYGLNKSEVDQFVTMKVYTDTNRLLHKPSKEDIIHIGVVMANIETAKTAWIKGRLRLIPGQERFWYRACKNCHTSLGHQHEDHQPCPTCDTADPITLMCHVAVTITDTTETAHVEIYSPNVEPLTPFTAHQLKQAEDEGRSVVNELEAALENKHVVAYIKYFDKLIRGVMVRKFPLAKIYMHDDVFPVVQTPPKQSTNEASSSNMILPQEVVDLSKDEEDSDQFFTPSLKAAADEIYNPLEAVDVDAHVTDQSSCKRVLFPDNAPKLTPVVKIEPPDDNVILKVAMTDPSNAESPTKKVKTKAKKD